MKKNRSRMSLGAISFVTGIVLLFMTRVKVFDQSIATVYDTWEILSYILVSLWLILSALNKIGMVLDQKLIKLNMVASFSFLALFFFVVMVPVIFLQQPTTPFVETDWPYLLFLFLWTTVDISDCFSA